MIIYRYRLWGDESRGVPLARPPRPRVGTLIRAELCPGLVISPIRTPLRWLYFMPPRLVDGRCGRRGDGMVVGRRRRVDRIHP